MHPFEVGTTGEINHGFDFVLVDEFEKHVGYLCNIVAVVITANTSESGGRMKKGFDFGSELETLEWWC